MSSPSFAELFTPKLVTVFREGYGLAALRADAVAGLTVAVVALPLSMAIAIGSGVSPERGLYTAIVGGFLISLLGGSRFQIGGPAGAFIALVAVIVQRHGYDGLVLATAMAGLMMLAVGLLQLGTYIKYIPYPVTVGFTTGIAVIILVSQIKDMLGLTLEGEPAALVPKLGALWAALPTMHIPTVIVAACSIAIILVLRRLRPTWPGLLIAVVAAALACWLLPLGVDTIGSRFGALPSSLPAPALPAFSLEKAYAVLPDAVAIALLCAIESLLSAVVADGMTGRRHRSNCELVAQGVANVGSVAFGGICVTGTIARTATNVRAGARGPVAGMLHSVYLLLFLMVASPLVAYVPLASLAAVLVVVAWNMAEKEEVWTLVRASRGDAVVLIATFALTLLFDLLVGISVGVVLGAFLFLHRMAESVEVEGGPSLVEEDRADFGQARTAYGGEAGQAADVMVYRISGAFFFGATARVSHILDRIGAYPKLLVLDFASVPMVDITAAKSLEAFIGKMQRAGTQVAIAGAREPVRKSLQAVGLSPPHVSFVADAAELVATDRVSAQEAHR